ncbi:kinase-like domain-containing protein [Xylaria castorea]|nr:kinase-like domain-containing protein [Xylaria castorea]
MEKNSEVDGTVSNRAENSIPTDYSALAKDDVQEYEYDYLTEQWGLEDISRYNKGGFHPIHIEDVLDDRYEVVHKLGSGGFGTVWLCRDHHLEKWRAVKVMTAEHSSNSAEAKMFEFLKQNSSLEELDKNHIATPLESFWIEGPNGRHLCLVMQIYGYRVSDWRLDLDNIEPSTRKDSAELCGQITQALAFLHSKGVCHGDFRPSNILMKLDQDALHELDQTQMIELLGEPEGYEVQTKSGESPCPKGPEYCVLNVSMMWCERLIIPEIVIIDFGESFFLNNPKNTTGIPTSYAAPEVLFHQVTGVGVDIWSLACTIYEIRTRDQLFGGSFYGSNFNRVVYEMEIILGPLAMPYREVWDCEGLKGPDTIARACDEEDSPESAATCSLKSLECGRNDHIRDSGYDDILEAILGAEREQCHSLLSEDRWKPPIKYRYERKEVLALADLLRRLLKYHPEERVGAESILQHEWLQSTRASYKARAEADEDELLGLEFL